MLTSPAPSASHQEKFQYAVSGLSQPVILFWPDRSLNCVYSYIFFFKGTSNSISVYSKLCTLPYNHSCWESHATHLRVLVWCVTVVDSVVLIFAQARLLAQTYIFCGLSSPSIVFPICQLDCSWVVNRSVPGCHWFCRINNVWNIYVQLKDTRWHHQLCF